METKNYEKRNYVFLYRGLLVVRDALLEFIVNTLKIFYGTEWWKLGVEPAFRAEDMEKLKQQFEKRFANPDGPARPGTELYEILDMNYFGNIIEYNWKKVFSGKLNNDRTLIAYLKEVVAYRNPVAHTETGDLQDDDAFRGLDTSDRLLRLIDRNAAQQIEKIKNELRKAWIYGEIGISTFTPDRVGINIEKGFANLEEALYQKNAVQQDIELLLNLKNAISSNVSLLEEHKQPGLSFEQDVSAIQSLQVLCQQYLGIDFATICIESPLCINLRRRTWQIKLCELDDQIDRLAREIEHLERSLEIQKGIGLEQKQWISSRIDFKQKLVQGLQNDLEKVRKELTAPVFFSVSRTTEPAIPEEQSFVVHVEIKNSWTEEDKDRLSRRAA
ncbi:MAG: Swt1 family HEPN domain-containing protein [Anaerolineales bacterium]